MLPRTGSTAADPTMFKSGAQTQTFNHDHASQMGHVAALRAQATRALAGKPTQPIVNQSGGATGVPGGAPAGFKQQAIHVVGQAGVKASVPTVHAAIDHLAASGHLTPFQGAALKQHTGPLVGPNGAQTMGMITNAMMAAAR